MIVFDFDGVLFDSVDEVAVSAYNAATTSIASSRCELPEKYLETFRHNRFAARRGSDMPTLATWCLQHPGKLIAATELEGIAEQVGETSNGIEASFFSARESFLLRDRKAWLSLSVPFEPLWGELKGQSAEKLVILTTKNQSAVLELSSFYGIQLDSENIFSGDEMTTKTENFNKIATRFSKPSYIFIDDSLDNLREIARHPTLSDRISLHLADWGYLGPEDRGAAKDEGFLLITQEETINLIS